MRERTAHRPRIPLWLALVGPATAWMGHLLTTYGLVYVTCPPGGRVWFLVATVLTLLVIGLVIVATRPDPERDIPREVIADPQGEGGGETMSRVAWMLAGFFFLVTLMAGVGTMLVSPCL